MPEKLLQNIIRGFTCFIALIIVLRLFSSCNTNTEQIFFEEAGTLLWVDSTLDDVAIKEAVRQTIENSSIIVAQVSWSPGNEDFFKNIEWYSKLASDHGKSFMINIDWQENNRSGMRDGETFENDQVRKQFNNDILNLTSKYNPDYLTLGVEVNYYALTSPEGYEQYVKLFNEIKNSVKSTHPNIKIGLSFQLELLYGIHTEWKEENTLQALDAIVENLDYIGISTYPNFSRSSNDNSFYSLNYIDSISSSYNLPTGILETGISKSDYKEQERKKFIQLVFQKYEEANLKFLIWGSMIDGAEKSNWENEIGLLNSDGSTKSEFQIWKKNINDILK